VSGNIVLLVQGVRRRRVAVRQSARHAACWRVPGEGRTRAHREAREGHGEGVRE
jgi:hypothetical protein